MRVFDRVAHTRLSGQVNDAGNIGAGSFKEIFHGAAVCEVNFVEFKSGIFIQLFESVTL